MACAWHLADQDVLQMRNLDHLRLLVLSIIAQNRLGIERSRSWLATGVLIKWAMMAGRISVFDAEMRRRTWTTLVELGLQTALEKGMPPAVQAFSYRSVPTLNINDTDIESSAVKLPAGQPFDILTDYPLSVVLAQSPGLRLRACTLIYSSILNTDYESVLHLDRELWRYLFEALRWFTPRETYILDSFIKSKIGHGIMSIHTQIAAKALKESTSVHSARSLLEIASMILSIQKHLHELSGRLSFLNIGDCTMQAFYSFCHVLCIRSDKITLANCETCFLWTSRDVEMLFHTPAVLAFIKARLRLHQAMLHKSEVAERVVNFAQLQILLHANGHACLLLYGAFLRTIC
ncbi:hypothetical protein ASPFODRAFT_85938 [Aspergillus luchuensis CBS 106.47]|uniref:Transcription factor domain-containing protein n=1 Tax=Aspergillus luchuensis (strain CBS 106.47) TaxID=1137211 RepID=A0A1M3T0J4_ASPLC|nr:hypothetical protein ASPFODRAFT_85938 [Aspergillus luchuensis CBS 106.47]